ncbi:MAG: hypothetical protein IJS03_03385 [Eubacterium sp.]|nr:hypothetical protein [Eubacterium sp.]
MNSKFKNGTFWIMAKHGANRAEKKNKSTVWYTEYCKLVPYEVKSVSEIGLTKEDVKLIGHRGFRAVAPENTLPAYEEAGKAGFYGAECDTYRTKDGVWVVHHDPVLYRMMGVNRFIEDCTYDELMNYSYTNGHNIDKYPDLKITTLEEYYEVCKKYGMQAIVEIKYTHSLNHLDELIDIRDKYGVPTTYIAFDFENIKKLRKLCDAPLFYLVYSITSYDIALAKTVKNCGISYDGNNKNNHKNDCKMIKKCHLKGLETATWAVDDLDTINTIVNCGTKFVTTNSVIY